MVNRHYKLDETSVLTIDDKIFFIGIISICYIIKATKVVYIYSAPHPYRIFNTWAGDPSKLIMLEKVIECVQAQNLLSLVTRSGICLVNGLHELQAEFPDYLCNVRGRGTMVAFTCPTKEIRNLIHKKLLERGKYKNKIISFYIVLVGFWY